MENQLNHFRLEQLAEAEYETWSLTNMVKLAVQEGDIAKAKAFANVAICKINKAKYFRTILSNDIYFPDTYDFVSTEMAWSKELPEMTIPEILSSLRGIVAGPSPLGRAPVMRVWRRGTGINYLRRRASMNDRLIDPDIQMIYHSHPHPLETNDCSEQPAKNVRVRSHQRAQRNVHTRNYSSHFDLNVLLCQAAHLSDSELIKLLLEKGADITIRDIHGKTPLHIACERNTFEIIKLLAEYSPAYILKMPDRCGRTPLDIACRCNSPAVVQYLLSQGSSVDVKVVNSEKCDPLLAVASNRKYAKEIASLVLDAGADIDRINYDCDTLLTTAIAKAAKEMQLGRRPSAHQSYVDLCMMLIDRGCNVNAANRSGDTALHIAVRTEQENIVRKLLISKSDVDRVNCRGCSPLVDACRIGNQRIVDLLISCGAHLNFNLKLENDHRFHYAISKMKQCKTLENMCYITIRKNVRNVEKDVIQLRQLPPLLVKRLLLKE